MAKPKAISSPEKITFRGCHIVNFDMTQSGKREMCSVHIHLRADFSDPLREAMGWEPRPAGWGAGNLEGLLTGVEMMLRPSQRELDKYAFKMPIRSVKDFKLALKGKGEDQEEFITFTVETTSKRAYVTLGSWVENIGKAKAALTITYSDEEQIKIGDVTATDEQRQAALEIN